MDFTLPDTAVAVREGVLRAMSGFDHAYWSRLEEEHRFPDEAWAALGEGGWLGLSVPEEYGGGGQGLLELAVANEALASTGATQGTFLYILTPGFGAMTITRHGTDEQKKEILPGLAAGDTQFCMALTEPDAGSNALAITTHARRDGDDFLIKGQKIWISGVDRADWMVAITRTIPAADAKPRTAGFTLFLVDVKEALKAGTLTFQPIPKMGSNIVTSSQVFFDDVRVPAHRVIGEVDQGFGVLWDVLNPERILAAAGGVGAADAALQLACDYAREREVFGRPIGANQAIQFPLAQIKAKTELGRLMAYKAAWLFDQGLPCGNETNVAKLTGAQVAWEAADQAFQTFGGMAYSKEFPIERLFRDARIGKNIPVAEELILAHIGTQMLNLPRSY
ncbi:acyl-CoA dehydrogenase [Aeromicrobium panaciterrae]|uniref:Acyl-CoA dehydrogenase n=1 Tax=Aeromicrobium panaciterrae TaxID=363861 RepID=A0ABU1URI1_9ACTN|nr:acyl-CoA dehydrogenase family protein [Aeromicrobium panaciterrae]MDR7087792.1 acyl-CoA dehydrogenase [Aeromicrobium panaciterrae]